MRRRIIMSENLYENLANHLSCRTCEQLAFLFAGRSESEVHLDLLVRDTRLVQQKELKGRGERGLELSDEVRSEVFCRAARENYVVIEAHSHPGAIGGITFSSTDNQGEESLLPYVRGKLPGMPYGSIVWWRDSADARLWLPFRKRPDKVDSIRVVGSRIRDIIPTSAPSPKYASYDSNRYQRQILAFGQKGQEYLKATHVGIVGLGGIGSHVAQQLAYLGIGQFTLIDDDRIERANLNRLVGAFTTNIRDHKVKVAKKLIQRIAPGTRVNIFRSSLMRHLAINALRNIDVLIGCTDTDGSRLVLNELAKAYMLPYFDCAVSIEATADRIINIGGRVFFISPDGPCLLCAQEIDKILARQELESPFEKEIRRNHGYVAGANVQEPSVIGLNGIIASLAVGEVMALVTGWRKPILFQVYYGDGRNNSCVHRKISQNPRCLHCMTGTGKGDAAMLERYDRSNLPRDLPK